MEITAEQFKKILTEAGLENAGAGVIFPWGSKIVEPGLAGGLVNGVLEGCVQHMVAVLRSRTLKVLM